MPKGHVRLDGVEFLLRNPSQSRYYPVNQMAPQFSQGNSQYTDNTSWEAKVVQDWQDGLGKTRQGGGLVYSQLDTRIPGQVILPPKLSIVWHDNLHPESIDADEWTGEIRVGRGGPTEKLYLYLGDIDRNPPRLLWIYMQLNSGCTVELRGSAYDEEESAYVEEQIALVSVPPVSVDKAYRWYHVGIPDDIPTGTYDDLYMVIVPAEEDFISLPTWDKPELDSEMKVWDAVEEEWEYEASRNRTFGIIAENELSENPSLPVVTAFAEFNEKMYMAAGTSLYVYNDDMWDVVDDDGKITAPVTSLAVWGEELLIAQGDSAPYAYMSEAEVFGVAGVPANLFKALRGYLYRSVGNSLYYSGDGGITWSDPMVCAAPHHSIRGIAELDGEVYVGTDQAVVRIAPGDFPVIMSEFGGSSPENGGAMISHQGAMYIAAEGQYNQVSSGSMRDIWWGSKQDGFQGFSRGNVKGATAMINWPVVSTAELDTTMGFSGIYAWQEVGWHQMCELPQTMTATALYYDRIRQRLWIGTDIGFVVWIPINNYMVNPYGDSNIRFEQFGWMETDWFWGEILENRKDIESMFIAGDRFSETKWVDVYWQDEETGAENTLGDPGTGDEVGEIIDEVEWVVGEEVWDWQFLGRYQGNSWTWRWLRRNYRPFTKRIRFGFLMGSDTATRVHRISAWRLKYHTMIQDWFGFDIAVMCSGTAEVPQQMLDGEPNPLTATEQVAHLNRLVKDGQPFPFTDWLGREWEVKVKNASASPEQYEFYDDQGQHYTLYTLQLEQMNPDGADDRGLIRG